MIRGLGAHAVGMKHGRRRCIALRHMGVRVGALSCITNLAAGIRGRGRSITRKSKRPRARGGRSS